MRLITWNCQGAFRKKADYILKQKPDILVIQECEHPDKLQFGNKTMQPLDSLWLGDNPHKGLGIFSYSAYRFQLLDQHNPAFKFVAPIAVTGGAMEFLLFAIWANNPGDPQGQYVEQVWQAIQFYDTLINHAPIILTGDFNSNTIWDRKHRIGNHSHVVEKLSSRNINSLYHHHYKQQQGKEKHPTFFLYRNIDKPYHLDYCFASDSMFKLFKNLRIGKIKDWIEHSDHLPMEIEFGF